MNTWIPVTTQLPKSEKRVVAAYKNALGNWRIICAFYATKFSIEPDDFDNIWDDDWNEEEVTYYIPEGWYELVENLDDCSYLPVQYGTVSHWMPLPEAPHD